MVAVCIDEAGRQREPACVDDLVARRDPDVSRSGDPVATDADAAAIARSTAAVHEHGVLYERRLCRRDAWCGNERDAGRGAPEYRKTAGRKTAACTMMNDQILN